MAKSIRRKSAILFLTKRFQYQYGNDLNGFIKFSTLFHFIAHVGGIFLLYFLLTGCNGNGDNDTSDEVFSVTVSTNGKDYLIIKEDDTKEYVRTIRLLRDDTGILISSNGKKLQGYPAINNIINEGMLTDISVGQIDDGTSIIVESDGVVLASLNDQQTILGRIALAYFISPLRLTEIEPGYWRQSLESGQPIVGPPGDFSFNLLNINNDVDNEIDATLELSAVDTNYLILQDGEQIFYTQQRDFLSDNEGRVIDENNLQLIGYTRPDSLPGSDFDHEKFTITDPPGPLRFTTAPIAPRLTTQVELDLNLNTNHGKTVTSVFNTEDEASYHFSVSTSIFDSMGNIRPLTFFFVDLDADNEWEFYYLFDNSQQGGEYSLEFDEFGKPIATVTFDSQVLYPDSGALHMQVEIDVSNITQLTSDFIVNNIGVNGHPPLHAKEASITQCGELIIHTVPSTLDIVAAYVAVARFQHPENLSSIGGGLYTETIASGPPSIGVPCREGFEEVDGDTMD